MKKYLVMDIGCLECGVGSEVVGIFETEEKAQKIADDTSKKNNNWRAGGQSIPQVFEVDV